MQLLDKYAEASGQLVNKGKSTSYSGSISNSRISDLSNLLGFNHGTLPFNYQGVLDRCQPSTKLP